MKYKILILITVLIPQQILCMRGRDKNNPTKKVEAEVSIISTPRQRGSYTRPPMIRSNSHPKTRTKKKFPLILGINEDDINKKISSIGNTLEKVEIKVLNGIEEINALEKEIEKILINCILRYYATYNINSLEENPEEWFTIEIENEETSLIEKIRRKIKKIGTFLQNCSEVDYTLKEPPMEDTTTNQEPHKSEHDLTVRTVEKAIEAFMRKSLQASHDKRFKFINIRTYIENMGVFFEILDSERKKLMNIHSKYNLLVEEHLKERRIPSNEPLRDILPSIKELENVYHLKIINFKMDLEDFIFIRDNLKSLKVLSLSASNFHLIKNLPHTERGGLAIVLEI